VESGASPSETGNGRELRARGHVEALDLLAVEEVADGMPP
jgi:hypothetical protein